jgi:hypothetical protein
MNQDTGREDDMYFGQLPSDKELSDAIYTRFKDEMERLKGTTRFLRMIRSYTEFYGESEVAGGHTTSEVGRGGVQGELTMVRVNHYRSLLNTMLNLATIDPPKWEAIAVNSDWESLGEAQLANGLLDYYYHTKQLKGAIKAWVKATLLFGESWQQCTWSQAAGEMVGVKDIIIDQEEGVKELGEGDDPGDAEPVQMPIYNGDIEFILHTPLTCVVDSAAENRGQPRWCITMRFPSRWDLIAQFPQHEEHIRRAPGRVDHMDEMRFQPGNAESKHDDTVAVLELWHASTPAVPGGRRCMVLTADIPPLLDGPLPYGSIPVKRLTTDDILLGAGGYTPMWDLLSICEMIHAQYSTISTNHAAFGTQKIWGQAGDDVEHTELSKSLVLIKSKVKPEALNLVHTPKEVFDFLEKLEAVAQLLVNQNEYTRGTADTSSLSGSAMAFLHSASVQANSGLQEAVRDAEGELGSHIVDTLRRYVDEPRVASIVGRHGAYSSEEFSGKNLAGVGRVYVKSGSSWTDTAAGRMELAKMLQDSGYVQNGQQFLAVLTTGRLEPMYERELGQVMLIRRENEILEGRGDGKLVVAPTDLHTMHIREHACVLDDPTIRHDDEVVQRVSAHIMEHMQALQNPAMAALQAVLGEQSLTSPEGAPGGGGEIPGEPEGPSMPEGPVEPVSGERMELVGQPEAVA